MLSVGRLSEIQNKKVLIVGDVGLDEYAFGAVKRISPEAPVPVLEVESEETRLGLATNVAQNIHELGSEVILVSVIGKDETANRLGKLIQEKGISTEHLVRDLTRPTTRKLRVMAGHHHLVRVDYEQRRPLDSDVLALLLKNVETTIKNVDAVIIQDYAKGVLNSKVLKEVISLAKAHRKLVVVDPHRSTPLSYYQGADLMTPNRDEALALASVKEDQVEFEESWVERLGEILMRGIGSERMVITRGKDGMSFFENDLHERVPTFAREVFDVTGAGDTAVAALTLGLVAGWSLKDACILSNYASGVVVAQPGCVPCGFGDLKELISLDSSENQVGVPND
ncbi:MAG: D-glycero-beta-D-manno-heptose-7-phosphate kinase [Bdellovibrionales bacterium CG10_big_fil_rev_8_21_14_0_10_45_34]|nr:MAG: D-glycero-beta-D-manno-heptose-7-phosphate kinase [Bdellovibrionales bacterium CG10_big_fil_rev_8_21_14_0_10_45_34]